MMIPTRVLASPSLPLLLLLFVFSSLFAACMSQSAFSENYEEIWGGAHLKVLDGQRGVILTMDKASGSGFRSKLKYGSGFFHLRIKLPRSNSAGIVTAYYLTSEQSNGHAELDFEFLGNVEGRPITVQTNVFVNGRGNREQRVNLWFDPSAAFHDYSILWNPHQIVFFVDEVPIRVFANKENIGVSYPSIPMRVIASLWNGEDWATDGGQTKIDWSYAPFTANFQGFKVDGCTTTLSKDPRCSSSSLWWNNASFQQLSAYEKAEYQNIKKTYMTYDYCNDVKRFPIFPPECPQ